MASLESPFNLEEAVVGRMLFSVAGESLKMIFLAIVVSYFRRSKRISYGIVLCISASYLSYILFEILLIFQINDIKNDQDIKVRKPAIFSLILIILSYFLSISLVFFEKRWIKYVKSSDFQDFPDKSFLNERERDLPFLLYGSFENRDEFTSFTDCFCLDERFG